jgi:hypothetical protein
MKRYLISGAMTLIAGLILTSCHDKDVEYSYGASQKTQAYDQAFKETFGTPAAGHNWGFTVVEDNSSSATTRALTRGHNKNSNQWASEGWIIPDPLTLEQKDKVRRYFQHNPNPQGISVNYTDFFVQQVYKGGSNLTGSQTQESYYFANGDYERGSSHMDKLTAGTMEDHINDFNNGDRGEINVQNNNLIGEHKDAITLMVNSQTNCFGFHNSRDSKQYNDQYVIIPGNVIDQWALKEYGETEHSVTGMFFVGFDYEADKAAYDQNGNLSVNPNYLVTETTAADGVAIPNKNDGKRYHIGGADGYYSDWIVRITKGVKKDNSSVTTTTQITQEIPHGKTFRITKWVVKDKGRVFCEDLGGNYTTDREDFDFNDIVFDAVVWSKQEFIWEDRAVQATDSEGHLLWEQVDVPKTINGSYVYNFGDGETTVIPEGKTESEVAAAIVKESVDATDENNQRIPVYKKENGALVYERVELEEYRGQEEYYAEIVLVATGATIGCSVAGVEVHDAFGVGYTTMVNTVGGSSTAFGSYVDKTPVYLGELKKIDSPTLDAIPITVLWKSGIDGATKLRRHNTAAGAAFMDVPQKFQVPLGTPWSQERVRIDKAYPSFLTYVKIPSYEWTTATGEDAPDPLFLFEQSYPNIFSGDKYVNGYEDTELVESDNYHTTSPEVVTGDPVNSNPPSVDTGQTVTPADVTGAPISSSSFTLDQYGNGANGNDVIVSASNSTFDNAGYHSKLRIYGNPTNSSDWGISIITTWSNPVSFENSTTGIITSSNNDSNVSSFANNGVIELTFDEDTKDLLKEQGLKIIGKNITVTSVTLDNTTKTTPPVVSYQGTTIYANPSGQFTIDNSNFANVKDKDEIRIYYTKDPSGWWQVQTWEGFNQGYQYTIAGWGGTSINSKSEFLKTDSDGHKYILLPVDTSLANMLKERGIKIQVDQIKPACVTLVSK